MLNVEDFIRRLRAREIDGAAAAEIFEACSAEERERVLRSMEEAVAPAPTPSSAAPRRDLLLIRNNHNCTEGQLSFLRRFIADYTARHPRSKALAAQSRRRLADQRAPANFNLLLKEMQFPITVTTARGAWLEDVDGNRYIDIACDFGVNLFGHAPDFIAEALREQLEAGWALSGRYGSLAEAADLFCELTGHDRVVFCQSGTEALMSALRLARACTDRQRAVVFNYAYHGHADVFLNEYTPGVSERALEDAVALNYGTEAALSEIERLAPELAAVIVEPVQSENLDCQPVDFLRRLRALTERHGIVLIFDEMISGLRMHPRGCQGLFGVDADLATYGKVLGGGMTAGAVAGRGEIMEWVDGGHWAYGDDSKPATATYIAGTHTQNPLKMACTLAVLRRLRTVSPRLQDDLAARTTSLVERVNAHAREIGAPFRAIGFRSQFRLHFDSPHFTLTQGLFLFLLHQAGVMYHMHGNCFLTEAHTADDVDRVVGAVCHALDILVEEGFFYRGTGAADEVPGSIKRIRGRGGEATTPNPSESVTVQPLKTSPPTDGPAPEAAVAMVKAAVAQFLEMGLQEFTVDDELGDLGMDSIMLMKVLKLLSGQVDRRLSIKAFSGVRTTRDVARRIVELQTASSTIHPELHRDALAELQAPVDAPRLQIASGASATSEAPRAPVQGGKQQARSDIAIVGLSATLPGAPNLAIFWENLLQGHVSIAPAPKDRLAGTAGLGDENLWGAFVEGYDTFDPLFFRISPREARFMDPQERLLLMEAYSALEDAGISPQSIGGRRVGVFVGYEFNDYAEEMARFNQETHDDIGAMASAGLPYFLANRLSYSFDLVGPSEAVNLNCASSAVSINRAVQSLRNGESELAIVAGVSLNLSLESYRRAGGLLSPDGRCSVFDIEANGFAKGEGCVVAVLKPLADAVRDGDNIYASIRACHQTYRGAGASMSEVQPDRLRQTISECHQIAGVEGRDVHYIEVDGYCTVEGDAAEVQAIRAALSSEGAPAGPARWCGLGSLKPNIGNLEPASALVSVAKVAMGLKALRMPRTVGVRALNPAIAVDDPNDPLFIATEDVDLAHLAGGARPVCAGINSFADTGVNLHILLEAPPETLVSGAPTSAGAEVFTLSARTPQSLEDYADKWLEFLSTHPQVSITAIAQTVQEARDALSHRLAIVFSDVAGLISGLSAWRHGGPTSDCFEGVTSHQTDAAVGVATELTPPAAAQAWVEGLVVDWRSLNRRTSREVLHQVPSYPFARKRYWFVADTEQDAMRLSDAALIVPAPSTAPISPAAAGDDDDIISIMRRLTAIVRKFLELESDDHFDEAANFAEIGLTSLAIVEFIEEINKDFGLHLPETTAFDYPNLETLARQILSLGKDRAVPEPRRSAAFA